MDKISYHSKLFRCIIFLFLFIFVMIFTRPNLIHADSFSVQNGVLFEEDGFMIETTGFGQDEWGLSGLAITITNNTEKDVSVSSNNVSLNGYSFGENLYGDITAGNQLDTFIYIQDYQMTMLNNDIIESIVVDFEFLDANTYSTILNTGDIEIKTSAYGNNTQKDVATTVLYEKDGLRISYVGYGPSLTYDSLYFCLENETNDLVALYVDNMSVNGSMINAWQSGSNTYPGQKRLFLEGLDGYDSLAGLDVGISFFISRNEVYSTNDQSTGTLTFNTGESTGYFDTGRLGKEGSTDTETIEELQSQIMTLESENEDLRSQLSMSDSSNLGDTLTRNDFVVPHHFGWYTSVDAVLAFYHDHTDLVEGEDYSYDESTRVLNDQTDTYHGCSSITSYSFSEKEELTSIFHILADIGTYEDGKKVYDSLNEGFGTVCTENDMHIEELRSTITSLWGADIKDDSEWICRGGITIYNCLLLDGEDAYIIVISGTEEGYGDMTE